MKIMITLLLLFLVGCTKMQHTPEALRGEWYPEMDVDRHEYVTRFITNFSPEVQEAMAYAAIGLYEESKKPILINKVSLLIPVMSTEPFDLMTNFHANISYAPPSIDFPDADDKLQFRLDPDGRLIMVSSSTTNFYSKKTDNEEREERSE